MKKIAADLLRIGRYPALAMMTLSVIVLWWLGGRAEDLSYTQLLVQVAIWSSAFVFNGLFFVWEELRVVLEAVADRLEKGEE